MRSVHPPEIVERARQLVTTTTRRLSDIARELDTSERTIRHWRAMHRWIRPPGADIAEQRKIPQSRYPALRRLYENRGRVADIAMLAGCTVRHVNGIADANGWTPRKASAAHGQPAPSPSPALAEIQAALRDPALRRGDRIALVERAAAVIAADAIGGDRAAEAAMQTLARAAALVKSLPEETAAPAAGKDSHGPDPIDPFPDANYLIEEIARRFEEFGNDLLHPRVLAAIAETTP